MDGGAAAGMDGGDAETSARGVESKSPPDSVNTGGGGGRNPTNPATGDPAAKLPSILG